MLFGDPIVFNSVDRPSYNKLLIRPIVKYRAKEKIIRAKDQTRSVAATARSDTQTELLEATEQCLHRYGLNGLSTRRVADAARMPLSQIHYHFGSKEDLVLALLAYKNERLLNRQAAMYAQDLPLSKRWKQACDYLDEDLSSGYVRVLQEMMAAGWSNPAIAKAVRQLLGGWFALLTRVADEAAERIARTGPFKSDEIASLVGAAFLGAEALLLLGVQESEIPLRRALRRFGALIQSAEKAN
jgi:AcrR family transcriptional regulator